jgi:aspartyl-tRNA(Asn)/glutamyl-tRNA(Gln) amidotransferase subunit A
VSALEGIFLSRPSGDRLARARLDVAPDEGDRLQPVPTDPAPRLAVKDLFDTAGLTTTYGSILFVDHVPTATAEAVRRLEDSGYVNVGKTNLHEFAYGISSQNPHFGTVPNPVAPGRLAGGSSGGNGAALAAGLAELALGTDSAGSIRIPAAWCGVVGFKPSHGLVPLDGCFPLAPSFDVAGPMARTVAECTRAMNALAPGFAYTRIDSPADVAVGVAFGDRADPLVRKCFEEVAELFPNRREVEPPAVGGVYTAFRREVADVHRELFAEHADEYGENVRPKIELCLAVTDGEYEAAVRRHDEVREQSLELLEGLDVLLTPTVPMVAPPDDVDELDIRERGISLTYPFSACGWPALALPSGPAEDGLPASVQIAAPPGRDSLVLAVGELVEASLERGTAAA